MFTLEIDSGLICRTMQFVDPKVEEAYQLDNRERHLFRMEMYTVCVCRVEAVADGALRF